MSERPKYSDDEPPLEALSMEALEADRDGWMQLAIERQRRIDTLTAEVAPWRELKAAMNRNELTHEDAYYAVERTAREEGKQ